MGFFGIILAARLEGNVGTMWENDVSKTDLGIKKPTNYSKHMTQRRFKDIRTYMSFVFADSKLEKSDVW